MIGGTGGLVAAEAEEEDESGPGVGFGGWELEELFLCGAAEEGDGPGAGDDFAVVEGECAG